MVVNESPLLVFLHGSRGAFLPCSVPRRLTLQTAAPAPLCCLLAEPSHGGSWREIRGQGTGSLLWLCSSMKSSHHSLSASPPPAPPGSGWHVAGMVASEPPSASRPFDKRPSSAPRGVKAVFCRDPSGHTCCPCHQDSVRPEFPSLAMNSQPPPLFHFSVPKKAAGRQTREWGGPRG